MEATAVSVGKAVLDGALGYAKSKAAEEIALQLGIDGDVSFITDELEMMQSFLMTADEERDQQHKVLTTWVKQVRDLAYNVEDSLMDFALQSELEKESSLCIPCNPCDRRRIAKEVKELRAKVEDVSKRNLRYSLIKGSDSMASATGVEQPGIAAAAMFGTDEAWRYAAKLEKSKLDLHQLITSEEEDLRVIAVWGTSGDLGKMSAIRKAYDDLTVTAKFGCRAWVRLVHPFNPKEFLGSLVRQFYENSPKETGKAQERRSVLPFNPKEFLGSLVRQFYENSPEETGKAQEGTTVGANVLLKMEKMGQSDFAHEFSAKVSSNSYLIVINDLSTIEEWDCIKTYFPNKKNKSRIIVSTQQLEIATLCTEQPYQVSELKWLSSDQVLYLFHKKVFKDNAGKVVLHPDMMEQATLILKKCDGLPLAISTIGGFLATKPKTSIEWRKMNDRISAELEINPDYKINPDYGALPYHLKSIFLYLSVFPKDHIISRNRLVRRWIGEGYSREMHGMTAEEVGGKYFDELFDRSMILPGGGVSHYSGKIDSCQLHDIIRKICISKAREENLAFTLEEGCCLSGIRGAIRHLAIGSSWKRDKDVLESMLDLSNVRSLTVFGEWRSFFILDKMRFLRVLDLEDATRLRDHHLDKIGELLHLKYLSLRGCQSIYRLPNSLGNLRHLQTLDVRGTWIGRMILELPITITKLRNLQCLLAGCPFESGMDIGESLFSPRACCPLCFLCAKPMRPNLQDQQLLEDGLNRSHTVHKAHGTSTFQGVEVPRGFGKLKALHTLGAVSVPWGNGKGEATLKEIKELIQLRKLGVTGVNKKNNEKFWYAIAGHNQLKSLSVRRYDGEVELDGCFGRNLMPPKCLESLKLYGRLVKATEWIHQLQNLCKLYLQWTKLNQEADIQAIGMLPNLAVLRLRWNSFTGEQLHFQGSSFPSLMVLELYGFYGLKSVKFEEHAMPKLELLQADWCHRVEEISGLQFLTSLKEIRLGDSASAQWKEVQRQLRRIKTVKLTRLASINTSQYI